MTLEQFIGLIERSETLHEVRQLQQQHPDLVKLLEQQEVKNGRTDSERKAEA